MQTRIIDNDLLSIRQARLLSKSAKSTYKVFSKFSQDHFDNIIDSVAKKAIEHAQRLAILAFEEKGYAKDKTIKNVFAAKKYLRFYSRFFIFFRRRNFLIFASQFFKDEAVQMFFDTTDSLVNHIL
jgi:hypothetical protein